MAEAARTWLDTLDAKQHRIGQGAVPADDPEDNERRRWLRTAFAGPSSLLMGTAGCGPAPMAPAADHHRSAEHCHRGR
jgi:hypothetical protein